MTASIWSFALGCVAFLWGYASIFLPTTLNATPDGGNEIDPSRAMVAIIPVAIMTLVAGYLAWYARRGAAKAPSSAKINIARGLRSSGLALSLIGLAIALSFSYIW
jgi:hypothetical protein